MINMILYHFDQGNYYNKSPYSLNGYRKAVLIWKITSLF